MKDNSPSDRPKIKNPQLSIYVPEEQRIERIQLCQYLSDLEALFENDTVPTQENGGESGPEES